MPKRFDLLFLVGLACGTSLAPMACGETEQFRAILASEHVLAGGTATSTSGASGRAEFTLTWDPADPQASSLSYRLQLENADLDGLQTPELADDVTAIHLHDLNQCMAPSCLPGDTAGTVHVLNIYGSPRHDDAQLEVFAESGRVQGVWDASDANSLTPAPSFAPGDYLDQLRAGELFLMVHTREFPAGALGGYLVPEPCTGAALAGGMMLIALGTRHRRGLSGLRNEPGPRFGSKWSPQRSSLQKH